MIIRTPMIGDWSTDLDDGYDYQDTPEITVHDRPSERISALLGPDGEPLLVPIPRRAVGFDLRAKR